MTRMRLVMLLGACFVAPAALAADAPKEAVKTLDAVTIEGEVRLPQVLFITSRESDRPLEFLSLYAPVSSEELGASTVLPGMIHVPPDALVLDRVEPVATPPSPTPVEPSVQEEVHP